MEKIEKGHPLTQSADIYKENIETLKSLFPTIVKEGKIDLEELKALLDDELETDDEYYRFTWAGKNEARREANKPSTATLRPNKADSKNWDTTNNIFIEGDNLEVLKLMQKSYAGKIKMMYFDPPYNTGNDFVYKDNYADNLSNYLSITGQADDEGKRLNTNSESDGRYHSNWLNMMYPRLKLARNLLMDDGVGFISIDDHEVQNLRLLCNDIFGEENFISSISRVMKSGGAKGKFFTPNVEYILVYAKNIYSTKEFRATLNDEQIGRYYNKVETSGTRSGHIFGEERIYKASLDPRPNQRYWIECPDGSYVIPPGVNFPAKIQQGEKVIPTSEDGVWKWIFETYSREFELGNIVFKETSTSALVDQNNQQSKWNLYNKLWLEDQKEKGVVPSNFISDFENRQSAKELKELGIPFDFAKPSSLIKYLLQIGRVEKNDLVLDFFAGSATTAHAVMQQNADDGGSRKHFCVQLPESTDEKSEAYKAGYKNIAEISKERIRRAGEKILADKKTELEKLQKSTEGKMFQEDIQSQIDKLQSIIDNLDIGFKAFKLDSSNINAWDGSVKKFEVNLLSAEENIKLDRTEEDVLFEILLKYGLDLTVPIEEKKVESCRVYSIGGGVLFVCLSNKITTEIAEAIGNWKTELQPAKCRVLFKDNGFKDDVAKTNSIQILRQFGIEECNSI